MRPRGCGGIIPSCATDLPARIAAAKYLCTNAACQASETGLRVAGGFSLSRNLSLERHFRDARGGAVPAAAGRSGARLIGRDALASWPRA